jgi:hypothetical protein
MSFLQPLLLLALPLALLPIIIHLINQWRYQTKRWGAMMFLLAANRMSRGYAKLRQWLIMAMRMLVIAGLIFAISRPLSSGFLGWTGGGKADTTIVVLDRSPSMNQLGAGGQSKLETGKRQLAQVLQTLGSSHWVLIDSSSDEAQSFESLAALVDSPATKGSSATADLPKMMQTALDYLKNSRPGATEIWICSDLRTADWNADSGTWSAVREAFKQLPQSVRIHLVAYPQSPDSNTAIRVTEARRELDADGNVVMLSLQLSRTSADGSGADIRRTIPIQIDIEGARTELNVEMVGSQLEIRDHRVALAGTQQRGWGHVSIPADQNNADNSFYFVFDEPAQRRIVVVSDDRSTSRALGIAASIAPDAKQTATVEVLGPDQLDSLVLDKTSLLLWQSGLPESGLAKAIEEYVDGGGQVIFFPPSGMAGGELAVDDQRFLGVRWLGWSDPDLKVMVENWRGDQDLLAATRSGAGLPVGQLEIQGYAKLEGECIKLATLTGGDPLLARVPTDRGGVYFCTASTQSEASSLAVNGIVLYISIQRAIQKGLESLGNTVHRVAGAIDEPTTEWQMVTGNAEAISTEYGMQAGVYYEGDKLFAVNRALVEDQKEIIEDTQLNRIFAGLDFSRVNDQAGSLSGIVREIWRLFLVTMIAAMLIEAGLCLPRRVAQAFSFGVGTPRPAT